MNVVGYARLSRDEDKENYASITTQEDIIKEYAAKRGWTISKIYIDDNYSGYNFDRPAFKDMDSEISKGNIDVIVAKNLSRVGRNSGEIQVFCARLRELDVHLYTSEDGDRDVALDKEGTLGVFSWVNEMYIRKVSNDIRENMKTKQRAGTLIMGNFYGYKKIRLTDREKKNNPNAVFSLIVDEEIKPVIQLIFKLYISGFGYKKICDVLDDYGYPTPSQNAKRRREENDKISEKSLPVSNEWHTDMIARIIKDDLYIGTLRTRKKHARLMKGKQMKVPKEEQYVFSNHHEAIISEEDFQLAQEINQKRIDKAYRTNKAKYNYIFSSFLECGDCGHPLIGLNVRKSPVIVRGYNCTMYQKYGKTHCTNHTVKEEKVLFLFREFLKDVKSQYQEFISNIKTKDNKRNVKSAEEKTQKELSNAKAELKETLNLKIKALIKESNPEYKNAIEETYESIEMDLKKKISSLTNRLNDLQKVSSSDIENSIKSNIEIFDNLINSETPERSDLERVLNKIIVYEDRSLEYILKVSIEKLTYSDIL